MRDYPVFSEKSMLVIMRSKLTYGVIPICLSPSSILLCCTGIKVSFIRHVSK